MQKKIMCVLAFFAGISSRAFSSAGYASDGPEFILLLGCFLLMIAGLLEGIDYLKNNRKSLWIRLKAFWRKKPVHM